MSPFDQPAAPSTHPPATSPRWNRHTSLQCAIVASRGFCQSCAAYTGVGRQTGAERRVMRARTATTYGLDLRTHRQNLVRCLQCAGTRRGPRSLRKPRAKASKMDVVGVSSGHEVQACAARQPHHSRHGVREPAAPPHPAASWPPSCPPDRPPTCPQHTGNEQIGTQGEQG